MLKSIIYFVLAGLFLAGHGQPLAAQPADKWVPIALKEIDLGTGSATFEIPARTARYRAIRLELASGTARVTNIQISYRGAAPFASAEAIVLKAMEASAAIDRRNEDSAIERITLAFERQPGVKVALEISALLGLEAPAVGAARRVTPTPPVVATTPAPSQSQQQAPRRDEAQTPRPSTRGIAKAPAANDACKGKTICTPVPVFFGTNRAQTEPPDPERIAFSGRVDKIALGQAIVTVPKVQRALGSIPRPGWWDTMVMRRPASGNPAEHFTIPPGGVTVFASTDDFVAAVRRHQQSAGDFKDHAFVFVHGYNTSFDQALYRTAQIAFDLGTGDVPFGTAFLYSWPSSGELAGYFTDAEKARGSAELMRGFLDTVLAKSGAKHVHLIAHSMGNAVLLGALEGYKPPAAATGQIAQVIFAAPDVSVTDFQRVAAKVRGLAVGGLTLYASKSDRAMFAARQIYRGEARAGDVPEAGPVIAPGIDTIDISALSLDALSVSHALYADRKEILEDISTLMVKGVHPPDRRSERYREVMRDQSMFWRYVP